MVNPETSPTLSCLAAALLPLSKGKSQKDLEKKVDYYDVAKNLYQYLSGVQIKVLEDGKETVCKITEKKNY